MASDLYFKTKKIPIRLQSMIAVAGGGPAGLLIALLLSRRGLDVTVYEKEKANLKGTEWTARQYGINLNQRGQNALNKAGMLELVRDRSCMKTAITVNQHDGSQKLIPRELPHFTITRPELVACLRTQVEKEGNAKIVHDASFTGAIRRKKDSDDLLELDLDRGSLAGENHRQLSTVTASHVIAADGKWSAVRAGAADLEKIEACVPELGFKSHSEPSWGLLLHIPNIPAEWQQDASHVLVPKTLRSCLYGICQPLANGQCSVSLVFFDEILALHPWINAPAEDEAQRPWTGTSVGTDPAWRHRMHALLSAELPRLAAHATPAVLETAVQNRRASWVEVDRLHLVGGRVALLGDAAHSMTASLGEGCNCALESAVALDAALGRAASLGPLAASGISDAFVRYAEARLPEVRPVQLASAAGNRGGASRFF